MFEYPCDHATVFAIARPHKAAVFVVAEPVVIDDEFLQIVARGRSGDLETLTADLIMVFGTRHRLVPGFLQGIPH